MTLEDDMAHSREVTIASRSGLHSRPAMILSRAAAAEGVPVTIAKLGGSPASASSILAVMGLGVKSGDRVVVTASAADTVDRIAALLATDLDAA